MSSHESFEGLGVSGAEALRSFLARRPISKWESFERYEMKLDYCFLVSNQGRAAGQQHHSELEKSFESLKQSLRHRVAGIIVLVSFLVFISIFFMIPVLLAVGAEEWVWIIVIIGVAFPWLAILFALGIMSGRVQWNFEEEILVRRAGSYKKAIVQEVPKLFQKLAMEDAVVRVEDDHVLLKLKLTRGFIMKDSSGEAVTHYVDLGNFTIDARFEQRGDDLVVKVIYSGNPPRGHLNTAADTYEKLVVAFRSAVNESWERIRPRPLIQLDFTRLAELIASKGLVITAIRCPHCGGSLNLPASGETMKCPYCGITLKAIEVYEVIRSLLKELI